MWPMKNKLDQDLELIDEAMNSLVQAMSRPRAWDNIVARAGIDIDRPAVTLLHMLEKYSSEPCRLNDLAARLGVEAPSVTRKVKELEEQKLIRRVPDPKDGRAFDLEITNAGHKLLARIRAAKKDIFREVLEKWPAVDRNNFAELFYRLSQDLHIPQNKHQTERY